MKKFYIKTFGCQMNVYDSSKIADLMIQEGYKATENFKDADLVIVNTCHIREKVKEKIFTELGKVKIIKKNKIERGDYMVVVVTGCVAQTEGKEIFRRMPIVDIVVGPGSYHVLPKMISQVFKDQDNRIKNLEINFANEEKFDALPFCKEVKGISEFVVVQEGCNKFCAYCIVPYTRGREFSRSPEGVIEEVKALAKNGVKEVMLLGQNVDNYKGVDKNGQTVTLAGLIKSVAEIKGIERIRYMTSYPSQVTQDLIDAHRDIPKLMPYIHLPIQSGSDKILKAMNRRYTRDEYLEVVERLRSARPDIAISSDFIVGFAGETEEDFEQTLDLVKKVKYAQAFSFKYSPRKGTRGEKMTGQIAEEIKAKRLVKLQKLLNAQQTEFNKQFEGKTLPILVEGVARKGKNTMFGKTPYMQPVTFEYNGGPKVLTGKIVDIKLRETSTRGMKGQI